MKSKQSATKFRFGDGKIYISIENALIPAEIGGLKVNIETDVVPCDLLLLLSKCSMQKANTKLDFLNNKATMFGRETDLTFTRSGHYCIPLGRLSNAMQSKDDESSNLKVVLLNSSKLDSLSSVDKKKIAVKLHKQFSHPRSNKLHKLLRDGDIKDRELFNLIEKVEADCVICRQYKRPMPKPIVTFSFAKEFNESVAMDIKYHSSKLVLHLIDHATRFSAAGVVHSKDRDVIMCKIFQIWISVFGPPKQIFSDNGGEFSNEDFRVMGEKLNTNIRNTAAESPWSNGINERHNAILGSMISKVKDDTGCNLEVAVASAVASKNALANVYGFSSNQSVFGKNPNFPSNLTNKLPALEPVTSSDIVRQNLTAIHSARKAFIEAESSERISRALRQQTRQSKSSYISQW